MAALKLNPDKTMMQHEIFGHLKEYIGRIFHLHKINRIHSRLSGLESGQFLLKILEEINVRYEIDDEDLSRIPTAGPLVVVANHPYGGLEGIILASLLKSVRSDVKIMANYLLQRFRIS